MNLLPLHKRVMILNMLVEGMSLRAISRIADVSINTVTKLLIDAGWAAEAYHDQVVRGIRARHIQCDEIWSFCYAKENNLLRARNAPGGAGDVWTWTALDTDTKLILAYLVGDRTTDAARDLMVDLRSRTVGQVQITTDGLRAYLEAVEEAFGDTVDFAQLIKIYEEPPPGGKALQPVQVHRIAQDAGPGPAGHGAVSTSHVERHNLIMRMRMRRFTRLTNGFSKKLDNHFHMISLYILHYNFCRIHKSLRVTPTMEAGISSSPRNIGWIVSLIDARAPKPRRPRSYRPRRRSDRLTRTSS